ncbi:MAG TPA: hypothetical protein VFH47_04850 [Candidatus Thermoplasmatota archaeon]|nr:hypothetical protein [Candidatus Thermoplasmatota archaeon]
MRSFPAAALVLLALPLAFAGCFTGRPACDPVESSFQLPRLPQLFLQNDGDGLGSEGRAWLSVALAELAPGEVPLQQPVRDGVRTSEETLLPLAGNRSLVVIGGPTASDADAVGLHARQQGESCEPPQLAQVGLRPFDGLRAAASPGQGVHVLTAGFWPNGTLFYTNVDALHSSSWPRAGWYAWSGGDPLAVYVYGEQPSERPAWWTDPQAGTPVAGTIPGLGYGVTIRGFNEALKGLSTATTTVAVVAPEDAYTREGNEAHRLYGDTLVFVIRVVDVVALPCPAMLAQACAPSGTPPLGPLPATDGSRSPTTLM